jgi:hypothetical protein
VRVGRGKPHVSVDVFGQSCLDSPGITLSAEECDAIAEAWIRAARAIRAGQYGKVTALDCDGDEMLYVGIDYRNIPFDEEKGLPLIEEFKSSKTGKTL